MNNKGFTLIELLAVLIILVAIMLIAVPSITSSIERSKDKQYESKIELLISHAQLYASDYKINESELCVTTRTLLSDGYTNSRELEDPRTDGTINGYVNYKDGKLTFTEGTPSVSCN